jgi:predicted aldo/keto reductase-like oxidoreductase
VARSSKIGASTPGKKPKTPGSGRKKGTPNKVTADLRAMIMQAFNQLGGVSYLAKVAKVKPEVFCTLLGKTLPKEVNSNVNFFDEFYAGMDEAEKRAVAAERAERAKADAK